MSSSSNSHSQSAAHRAHHSCVICNQCRANWSNLTDRLRAANRGHPDPLLSSSVLARCAGCSAVYYCSKQCQRTNWPIHKTLCREIQAMHEKHKHHASTIHIISNEIANTVTTSSNTSNTSTSSTSNNTSSSSSTSINTFTHQTQTNNNIILTHPSISSHIPSPIQSTDSLLTQRSPDSYHQVYQPVTLHSIIEVSFVLKVACGETIARSFRPSPGYLIAQANAADEHAQAQAETLAGKSKSRNTSRIQHSSSYDPINNLSSSYDPIHSHLIPTNVYYTVTEMHADCQTIRRVRPDIIAGLLACIQQCVNKSFDSLQRSTRTYAIIPPELAYGESGIPDTVPPKSFIVADCEVQSIRPSPTRAQQLTQSVVDFVSQPIFNDDAIRSRIAAATTINGTSIPVVSSSQQSNVNENEMKD